MTRNILAIAFTCGSACSFAVATYRPPTRLIAKLVDGPQPVATVGERVERIIRLTNHGRETIEIDRVRKSCGCQSVVLLDSSLEPNETTDITVAITVRLQDSGTSKYVLLEYRDPEPRQLRVEVPVGRVINALVDKQLIDFGLIDVSRRPAQKEYQVEIDRRSLPLGLDAADLVIHAPESTLRFITLERRTGKDQIAVRLKPLEDLPSGVFAERFEVCVGSAEMRVSKKVEVRGSILRDQLLTRPQIMLLDWSRLDGRLGTARVFRLDGRKVVLSSVQLVGELQNWLETTVVDDEVEIVRKPNMLFLPDANGRTDGAIQMFVEGFRHPLNIPMLVHR